MEQIDNRPKHFLLIDIDGLRPDVFLSALKAGKIPNLAKLIGGSTFDHGLFVPISAPAPSITFCSQASLFTGAHPRDHSIMGNQFFDRFGRDERNQPRHYAFDVGDTLAVDDAVRVFTDSLAGDRLLKPTIYEKLAARGKSSVVAGNMYGKGATEWIKPSLDKIARFTKGGNLFGMSSEEYDGIIVDKLINYLQEHGLPTLTTIYFMGVDHDSHHYGPSHQEASLINLIDPAVGRLWEAISALGDDIFVAIFSDHGQIEVIADDAHSLRIGFPFDKEMGHLFTALGLDVHDYPGEDPHCDAVMALNGGMAAVYLQNRTGHWADRPDFNRDVKPVAAAFWQAHLHGTYAPELHGAVAAVLLRNVEKDGWNALYHAMTPDGKIVSLTEWFAAQPQALYLDPVNRLDNLCCRWAGDLLIISNYNEGYYFGGEIHGVHGGLHPDDSRATLAYGWPSGPATGWQEAVSAAIDARCRNENGRMAGTMDLLIGLAPLMEQA